MTAEDPFLSSPALVCSPSYKQKRPSAKRITCTYRFSCSKTKILLGLLRLGVLLHVLETLRRTKLEAAAVIHVPHGLQQDAHFWNPGIDREGHGTGVI